MEDDIREIRFKVVLVGDSFVGKTNIMSRYLKNEFHRDSNNTVRVEISSKYLKIEGYIIKAQLCDTAGQKKFKAITTTYFKGAEGVFIVYDITRKSSFESIDKWISDLTSLADEKLTVVLIGNKCDLEDQRQVTKEQGQEKANKLKVAFLETSAFSGKNVGKAFDIMMNEVYKKYQEEIFAENDKDIKIDQNVNLSVKEKNIKKEENNCNNINSKGINFLSIEEQNVEYRNKINKLENRIKELEKQIEEKDKIINQEKNKNYNLDKEIKKLKNLQNNIIDNNRLNELEEELKLFR